MTPDLPRIALFGGSFDPPHHGHLLSAETAVTACGLSRVVFIPCRESPLKGRVPGASGAARMEMLRLATRGLPWADVSDWELSRPGPSYSWQTVEYFASQFPEAHLHWLTGVDQWEVIERWARPDFLREHLTFVVFTRNGIRPQPREGWRSILLSADIAGSSTEARRLLAAGESAAGLLDADVEAFAVRERLYRPADPQ